MVIFLLLDWYAARQKNESRWSLDKFPMEYQTMEAWRRENCISMTNHK